MCISSVVHRMRVMLHLRKWVSLSSNVQEHPQGLALVLTIILHHDHESQGGLKLILDVDHTHSHHFTVTHTHSHFIVLKWCATFQYHLFLHNVPVTDLLTLCSCLLLLCDISSCCSSVISLIAVFCVFQVGCWCQLYPSKPTYCKGRVSTYSDGSIRNTMINHGVHLHVQPIADKSAKDEYHVNMRFSFQSVFLYKNVCNGLYADKMVQ